MYLMEPKRGQARRMWLKEKVGAAIRQTGCSCYRTGKDLANRVRGISDEPGHTASGGPVASESLHEEVHSKIAQIVSDPSQVHLMVDANGTVTLSGDVSHSDSDRLITAVELIPGVKLVINRLKIKGADRNECAPNQSPSQSALNL